MKKTLSLVLALMMLLSMLPAAVAETEEHEPVTLTFGGWGNYFVTMEVIEGFEAKYPWINVEFVSPLDRSLMAADLMRLAAEGNMPDVFNIEYPYTAFQNEWCYDMRELFENDPDSADYPEWLLNYCTTNSKLIALINTLYAFGIELNTSLLEENNIPVPGYDWTVDDWAEIARQLTVKGQSVGMEEIEDFMAYIIPQYDTEMGVYGYDDKNHAWHESDIITEAFDLFDGLVQDGAALNNYMFGNIGEEGDSDEVDAARATYMAETLGASDNLWLRGKVGMRVNASWNLAWPMNNDSVYSGFEWDFYPFPSGIEGEQGRSVLLNEYLCISASCKHPEEAYLLIKYLSFDMEGYERRIDAMLNYDREAIMAKYPDIDPAYISNSVVSYQMAPSNDERALEIFQKLIDASGMDGLEAIFDKRNDNAMLDPQRYALDWWNCYYTTGWWFDDFMATGMYDAATTMSQMITYNQQVTERAQKTYNFTYGYEK